MVPHQSAATADLKVAHYGLADFCDATDENLIASRLRNGDPLGLGTLIIDQLIDLDTIVVDAKSRPLAPAKADVKHFTFS